MSTETFCIIDGNAIIHRAYHAFPKTFTSPSTGEMTNAIYGFTRILLNVIKDLKPRYIACTFDLQAPTFRHIEYKEYKAKRPKADQELYDQIPRIKEIVRTLNIPILEAKGFEADDAIATAIAQIRNSNPEIRNTIVTGDRDTLQLVDEMTTVFTPKNGFSKATFYTPEKVREKFGLEPSQIIDYKALSGDQSDNIIGVPGVGEKTASNLLKIYGTIEKLYESLDDIQSKAIKEKLEKGKESAFFSKKMVILSAEAPIKFELKDCVTHEFDQPKVEKLFMELGFNSLLRTLLPTSPPRHSALDVIPTDSAIADERRNPLLLERDPSAPSTVGRDDNGKKENPQPSLF